MLASLSQILTSYFNTFRTLPILHPYILAVLWFNAFIFLNINIVVNLQFISLFYKLNKSFMNKSQLAVTSLLTIKHYSCLKNRIFVLNNMLFV